jgi:hypothetical protein
MTSAARMYTDLAPRNMTYDERRRYVKAPTKKTHLTLYPPKQERQQERRDHRLLVVMFIAERLVVGSLATYIVYGGYRLFMV